MYVVDKRSFRDDAEDAPPSVSGIFPMDDSHICVALWLWVQDILNFDSRQQYPK